VQQRLAFDARGLEECLEDLVHHFLEGPVQLRLCPFGERFIAEHTGLDEAVYSSSPFRILRRRGRRALH
jgi:hypothetical protein